MKAVPGLMEDERVSALEFTHLPAISGPAGSSSCLEIWWCSFLVS